MLASPIKHIRDDNVVCYSCGVLIPAPSYSIFCASCIRSRTVDQNLVNIVYLLNHVWKVEIGETSEGGAETHCWIEIVGGFDDGVMGFVHRVAKTNIAAAVNAARLWHAENFLPAPEPSISIDSAKGFVLPTSLNQLADPTIQNDELLHFLIETAQWTIAFTRPLTDSFSSPTSTVPNSPVPSTSSSFTPPRLLIHPQFKMHFSRAEIPRLERLLGIEHLYRRLGKTERANYSSYYNRGSGPQGSLSLSPSTSLTTRRPTPIKIHSAGPMNVPVPSRKPGSVDITFVLINFSQARLTCSSRLSASPFLLKSSL